MKLFWLLSLILTVRGLQFYVLIETEPQPWLTLVLEILAKHQISAIFLHAPRRDSILYHQIREAGHSFVNLEEFVNQTQTETLKVLLVPSIEYSHLADLSAWLAREIHYFKNQGYILVNWSERKSN